MTELKDVRKCDVNGTQVIICDVLETGAVLPHSILLDEYLNPTWEQDADSVFGFLKAAEATELQYEPTIEEITVNGYAFNGNHAKIENDMRQKLADEYNKLFAR